MSKIFSSQKIQKTIQIMLILALLAATFAFLPQPAVAATKAVVDKTSGSAGSLTAKLSGRKVTVSGENFSKNREFVINAKSGKGNAAKLGTLKSNNSGAFKATFTLPDKFKIIKSLTICAKDKKTGKRTCTLVK